MNKYPKIDSIFKRDEKGIFIFDEYACDEFAYLANNEWVWTEKVDGMNMRIIYKDREIIYRGRTDNSQIPPQLIERLNELFDVDKFREMFQCDVCLYGEGYGNKIQKTGQLYKDYQDFVLFDVFIDGWWLERKNVEEIAKSLGIEVVAVIMVGTLWNAVESVKKGFKSKWGDFIAEGLVGVPSTPLYTRKGERIITKIKHKDLSK